MGTPLRLPSSLMLKPSSVAGAAPSSCLFLIMITVNYTLYLFSGMIGYAPILGNPNQAGRKNLRMPTQRTHGGLYLVTLNNETPISTNARDRRVADRAIQVRRGDIKVGKAENLTRRHGNYIRNFGRDNVNFFVLAYIPDGKPDRHRAECAVFDCFRPFRIRGTTGRLNEWMNGVSVSDARAIALEALRDAGIEHLVVPEEGEGSADVPPIKGVGRICSAADGTDDANRDAAGRRQLA